MKILITGSNGQLGKELVNQLEAINQSINQPKYVILATTRSDLDISNQTNVDNFILHNKPDVVVNCAAYTKVDACEDNIEIAYKINALGVRNLAIASEKVNAKLIHISTDYVFNGFSKYPYREDNKTEPNSVYGKSKLMGEKFVEQFSHKYFILRTAWLYGNGNNFVKWRKDTYEKDSEGEMVEIKSPLSYCRERVCATTASLLPSRGIIFSFTCVR